eukprot:3950789-Prymnesium_polylepis.1
MFIPSDRLVHWKEARPNTLPKGVRRPVRYNLIAPRMRSIRIIPHAKKMKKRNTPVRRRVDACVLSGGKQPCGPAVRVLRPTSESAGPTTARDIVQRGADAGGAVLPFDVPRPYFPQMFSDSSQ